MTDAMTKSAAKQEWQMYWPVVVTAGLGFSLHTVSSYSLGLMMEPLGDEFGWGRAQVSLASLIPALLMIFLSPFVGAIIDRWGTRRIAIPSLALTGLSLAMMGLVSGSISQWIVLWFIYGLVSLGTKVTVWTAAISSTFDAARGLALGFTVAGAAITQIMAPPITQILVDNYGWRMAYVGLGIGWAAPPFILAIFLLRDMHDRQRLIRTPVANTEPVRLTGLTTREALKSKALIKIGISTLLTMFIGTAVLIHQVPILTSIGVERSDAAFLAALAGIAAFVGKIMTGWMVDRWNASVVGAVFLLVPTVAYWLMLNYGQNLQAILIAMIVIGYTSGAKLQISAYLTAKFAGLKNFGKIFGVMTSMIGIGGGLGSIAAGGVFDYFGHYKPILMLGIVLSFVSSWLIYTLGPFPDKDALPGGTESN